MKKIKTLILATMAFGAITFSSCKKDKQTPSTVTASVTADIDGTATTFNVHAFATTGTVNGKTITVVTGTSATGATVSITLGGTVTAGKTFNSTTTPDNEPQLLYSTASDDTFLNDDPLSQVSVTVNSVSSSSISGTFKGGVIEISEGGSTKSITNGKFSVSFIAGS